MRNYVKDKLKTSLKEIENKIKREIGTKREREREREKNLVAIVFRSIYRFLMFVSS